MFTRTEKTFAVALLAVCAIVAIVGFIIPGKSDPPNRIWFDAAGGDVIFDHTYHTSLAECSDCHHNMEEQGEDGEMNCRKCHYYGEASEVECGDPTHVRCVGANCTECHNELGASMSACDACHVRKGFAFEATGRVNAPLPDVVQLETDMGQVVFNHELHGSAGLGFSCNECHHEIEQSEGMEGLEREKRCRTCHYDLADQIESCELDDMHARCVGANCTMCHDADECETCHTE